MDITITSLMTDIMEYCGASLTDEQYILLKNAMNMALSDCEIKKKTYDIVVVNNNDRYIKEYVASLKLAGKSERTIKQYVNQVTNLLQDINKEIKDITRHDLKGYFARYMCNHNISTTTLVNMQRFTSPFFTYMFEEGYITTNPAAYLDIPKIKKPDIDPFTGEEIEIMRETVRKFKQNRLRNVALLEFLISTGCRVGEIPGIKISDVDFRNLSVVVTGKGNKTRTVYFTSGTLKYLKDYLNSRTDVADILFYSPRTNSPISRGGIERMFQKFNCNIRCNPHRFRHTFAQTCIDRGMSLEDLSHIMGHDNIQTTMRYYKTNQVKTRNAYQKYVS